MHLVGFIIRTDQAISAPNLFYDFTKLKVICIYKTALVSQQLFESIRDRQAFLTLPPTQLIVFHCTEIFNNLHFFQNVLIRL